jgi:phosphoribosylaminoimidazole-succinocarboxamide synthase
MSMRLAPKRGAGERAAAMIAELGELGFDARLEAESGELELGVAGSSQRARVLLDPASGTDLLEQAIRAVPLDFDSLPLVVEGDSKVVRAWTPQLVVERLKPTVYSFTHNRYGIAPGTDAVRARFSAEIFRRLEAAADIFQPPVKTAFVALLEIDDEPLLVQRKVETCNLEVRVKRYHIGSPLHRYLYTDRHPTVGNGEPLLRWSRFERPLVCFDWRHPLADERGERLSDEPLPDDYAALWMEDLASAKEVARQAFCWLEDLFSSIGVILVDICLLIDRSGQVLFGEISPDCMRIRLGQGDPSQARPLDKDVWRNDADPELVAKRYHQIHKLLNKIPINGGNHGEVHRE